MDKNFGLSSEEFEQLIIDLKKNETHFFKQVFLKHFNDCTAFIQRQNNASYDDAYDATMDALIQFRTLLVEGKLKYGNLKYLFTKMASQIHTRNLKKHQVLEINEDELETLYTPQYVVDEDLSLFNTVWDELSESCQELLKLHYYGNMKLKVIAEHLGKSSVAIRKQKERCINSIRTILQTRKSTSND